MSRGSPVGGSHETARHAFEGIRKIIELWARGLADKDPVIRLFTVLATIIGFLLLTIIVLASIHAGVYIFRNDAPDGMSANFLIWYPVLAVVAVVSLVFIGMMALLRVSERASVGTLSLGLANIERERYRVPPEVP